MTNGEYIYGITQLKDLLVEYIVVKHKCECEREFDHVPPCKLEGQGGYSDGSKAFKYVGTDHDPMTHSHPPKEELHTDAWGKSFKKTNGWDYETGEFIYNEKW